MATPNELIRIHDQHGGRHYLNLDHIIEVSVPAGGEDPTTVKVILTARNRAGDQREIYVAGETAEALLKWLDHRATAVPASPAPPLTGATVSPRPWQR